VKEWTLIHGHLLSMGGYTRLKDLDGKGKLRKPRKPGLLSTAEDWIMNWRDITEVVN